MSSDGLSKSQIETDHDAIEVTRVESSSGKVVLEIVGEFTVNGDRREKTMGAYHDGMSWKLNGHKGFSFARAIELGRAETREEIIDKAAQEVE